MESPERDLNPQLPLYRSGTLPLRHPGRIRTKIYNPLKAILYVELKCIFQSLFAAIVAWALEDIKEKNK